MRKNWLTFFESPTSLFIVHYTVDDYKYNPKQGLQDQSSTLTMTVQSMALNVFTSLTSEEESWLKTALAVVVVKRRLAAAAPNKPSTTTTSSSNNEAVPGEPQDGNAEDMASNTIVSIASSSTLERLFESTSNSSFLLNKQADPNHFKSMFQMAVTLAASYTTKNHNARSNDSITTPLSGIVSHLAYQLDLQDDLNIRFWIRESLTACESTTRVLAVSKVHQTLLEQHASPKIIAVALLVVSNLLKELYYGETRGVFNGHLLCVQLLVILEKAALGCGGSVFLDILEQVFGNLLVPTPTRDLAVFFQEENARGGLDAGAKLLIKIGLYRILNQVSAAAP